MGKTKVFIDSDVVISSLLSKKGASFLVLNNNSITPIISDVIQSEIEEVGRRLKIKLDGYESLGGIKVVKMNKAEQRVVDEFAGYVFDQEDSHVVCGAKRSKSKFLLTHNIKHYNVEKIKRDLNILVMKPGVFLQYLRSI